MFESKFVQTQCTQNPSLQVTFLPLTFFGSVCGSLRYWDEKGNYHDLPYEIGKMYILEDSTTPFALVPSQYEESSRMQVPVFIQSYAVQCEDGRWVFFH